MASRSSRSSSNSSRTSSKTNFEGTVLSVLTISGTNRSTSTRANHYRIPPAVPFSPAANYPQHHNARSLRDAQEEIETYDLQMANAAAIKQRGLEMARDAEIRERALAQQRDRVIQRTSLNALDTRHGLPPALVIERVPEHYVDRTLTSRAPRSVDTQSVRSSKSSKPKRVHFEVVGISRPARPKTIWGTPAWS